MILYLIIGLLFSWGIIDNEEEDKWYVIIIAGIVITLIWPMILAFTLKIIIDELRK